MYRDDNDEVDDDDNDDDDDDDYNKINESYIYISHFLRISFYVGTFIGISPGDGHNYYYIILLRRKKNCVAME